MSLELNVKEVRKRGSKIKIGDNEYKLSDFDTQKNKILKELKNVNYNDLADLVYRLQVTYDEIIDIIDLKYIVGSTKGYTLPPGIYEIIEINFMLKSSLPKETKVNITIDDVRLKSNWTNKKIRFTKMSTFYVFLGFPQSHSRELGDIRGCIQLIPGTYKSDKPINITGSDKFHLKCDCIRGSIVNGAREPNLYSFALSSKPGYKMYKEPRIKLLEKINKTVLIQLTFCLEDDDHKAVDFINETISFICQLIKI